MSVRPRRASAGSRWATVEPVPRPMVMPLWTSCAAASAARRFSLSPPLTDGTLSSLAMDARLWLSGAEGGPRSAGLSAERTVVGRSPEADVRLDDEAVSWNHLEIERRGDVLMATDLDSRNGTALNGERLERPRRLRDGDTLILGGCRLEVSTGAVTPVGATVASTDPGVALSEEERATAAALVAP